MEARIGYGHTRIESPVETANDRFKRRAGTWSWSAIGAGAVIHYLVFSLAPPIGVAGMPHPPGTRHALESIELLPAVRMPAPPEIVPEPAAPMVADLAPSAGEDLTIPPLSFDDIPFAEIPPPPAASSDGELAGFEHFVPRMVAPELRNRAEVVRALERYYPRALQNAGLGGSVLVWFWIDEQGEVRRYEIKRSSGHRGLDEAAEKVIDIMDFSPALDRGQPIRVIVALPIVFEAR